MSGFGKRDYFFSHDRRTYSRIPIESDVMYDDASRYVQRRTETKKAFIRPARHDVVDPSVITYCSGKDCITDEFSISSLFMMSSSVTTENRSFRVAGFRSQKARSMILCLCIFVAVWVSIEIVSNFQNFWESDHEPPRTQRFPDNYVATLLHSDQRSK